MVCRNDTPFFMLARYFSPVPPHAIQATLPDRPQAGQWSP